MKVSAFNGVSFSPMVMAALFSVIALVGISLWQVTGVWRGNNEEMVAKNGTPVITIGKTGSPDAEFDWQRDIDGLSPDDPDGLSNIGQNVLGILVGSYITLKDTGEYTPAQGAEIAHSIAEDLRANISFRLYGATDIKTDTDISLSRLLEYRNDMRMAFEPLLENSEYELELLGGYLETKDPAYLAELQNAVRNYRLATENVTKVLVPENAAIYHIGVLNALSEFEATLTQITKYVEDPFASAALLRTFNTAEEKMFTSFDALAGYFREYSRS